MSKLIPAALAAMVMASATVAMANNRYDPYWTNMSKPCAAFPATAPKANRRSGATSRIITADIHDVVSRNTA